MSARTVLRATAPRKLVVIILAFALAGSSASPTLAADAPTTSPCAKAQGLLEAGYLAEANDAFKAELGKDQCATVGLAAVLNAQAGKPQGLTDAQTAILDTRFAATTALIRGLEAAGFEDEARKMTQQLIQSFPHRSIPADLRAISQPVGWWRQAKGFAGPPLRVAAELAIALLAAVLIALVVAKVAGGLLGRASTRYTITPLTGVKDDDGLGQSDLLADGLSRISGKWGGTSVRRVSGGTTDFSLPEALTTAYPQAGVGAGLLSLLDRLMPRRLLEISAAVLPIDPVRGAGMTVAITKRGGRPVMIGKKMDPQRRPAEITIWESDFVPVSTDTPMAQRLERLMLPAAVWLAYNPRFGDATKALGTANWHSYAHFAVGERAQQRGDTDQARRSYCKALDADAANLGARLNFGGLLLYRPSPDGPKSETRADCASRLKLAEWLLEENGRMAHNMGARPPELHWRWLYLSAARALVAAEYELDAQRAAAQYELAAQRAAERAATQYALATRRAGALWAILRPDAQPALANPELAAAMRWPAFVLRRSIRLGLHKHHNKDNDLGLMDNEWWTANTLYNRACYFARLYAINGTTFNRDAAVRYLRDAVDRADEPKLMLTMARCDAALDGIASRLTTSQVEALTGPTEPSYTAERRRGHGIGVMVREAVATMGGTPNGAASLDQIEPARGA
ncbi:MAG: hypothetical protein ACXVUE_06190 [Solirubrobacteraceae bacterium]